MPSYKSNLMSQSYTLGICLAISGASLLISFSTLIMAYKIYSDTCGLLISKVEKAPKRKKISAKSSNITLVKRGTLSSGKSCWK